MSGAEDRIMALLGDAASGSRGNGGLWPATIRSCFELTRDARQYVGTSDGWRITEGRSNAKAPENALAYGGGAERKS